MTNDKKTISPKKYLLVVLLVFLVFFLRLKTVLQPKGEGWVGLYNDIGEVTLIGMVAEPPEVKGKWQRIKTQNPIRQLADKSQKLKGGILVKTRLYPKFEYGDILELTGELKTPPVFEDFSYKEYLEIEGIYSLMDFPKIKKVFKPEGLNKETLRVDLLKNIYILRQRLEEVINQILPEPHASLLAGILFGIKRNFNEEFYQMMQKAGVLHIIVASGYNIMIVSSFFLALAPIFGRKKNLVLAAFGVLIYAIIAGFQPPIVRAAIMGGGVILAESLGKRKDALLWLGVAASLMLFANPLLYKSVSFQLSFGAALGLLLFGSRLQKLLWRVPGVFRESLGTTLAVQIFTLPIILFNFHETSLVSLAVNTLVLETIPIIMGLGLVAVSAGLISVSLGTILAFPVWLILSYFVKIVEVLV